MRIAIFGILFFFSIMPLSLGAQSRYDDSAINAATASITAEAARVRAAASSALRQADQMRQAAHSVRQAASDARTEAVRMRSQVSEVNANTATAHATKGRLLAEELSARSDDVRNRAAIDRLKKNYEPLVQETYNVEQQQKFIDQAQKDLDTFIIFLNKYYDDHDRLSVYIKEALQLAKEADVSHQAWMEALAQLIEEKKPNFEDIINFTTLSEAAQKIVSFENSIPKMDELLRTEARAKISLNVANEKMKALKMDNSKLVGMRGLHITLEGSDFNSRLRDFYSIEENFRESVKQLNALQSLFDKKAERRSYLIRMIPIVWNRIANLRLQAANVSEGARIIQEIDASLRGPQKITAIRAQTTSFKSEIDQQLRYNFAPYAAYQAVMGAHKNFHEIRRDLNELKLTSNLLVELNALIRDEQAAIDARSNEITLILSGRNFDRYLNEWKRQARLIGIRNQQKFNAACRDLHREVLAITDFNKGSEQLFLDFKGGCS